VASEARLALAPPTQQLALGLSGERSLADDTSRPVEDIEATLTTKSIARIFDRWLELGAAPRVAAAVADLMGAGRGVR
jgi:hypothetical protein